MWTLNFHFCDMRRSYWHRDDARVQHTAVLLDSYCVQTSEVTKK